MAHAFQGVSAELHGNVEAAVRAYRRAKHFGRLANGGDWPATPETDDGTYRHPHSAILAERWRRESGQEIV